ncbi:diguanylate cyclase (GGDEF) domain-containing protein [Pseudidiomarina planktonica]|uniref:diguanylate cyclase n=1 Tax=Pseudidiomarina planktonica TaxID=1323738 RepID=A0A1Y6E7H3_9GAMM|nr:GGDEF domain-containing protein [Pseudidiomarina planktonica]RUO66366.1 GGDEF domain-containing protein [Pseudidiomarina planktonica]SMQ58529.1 diguanylate cyclase (GGDEF) domain-containing protein [Pseudidiomarina planktonica]
MVHLPTLIIIAITVNFLLAALMLVVYQIHRKLDCFIYWSASCFVFAIAAIVASTRTVIDFPLLTIFVADILFIGGPLLALLGIRSYLGRGMSRRFKLWLLVSAALVTLALAMSFSKPAWAQLVTSVVIAVIFFRAVVLLRGLNSRPPLPKYLLTMLFGIHAVAMLSQAAMLGTSLYFGESGQVALLLETLLISHILLTVCTAMVFPLLVFVTSEQHLTNLANIDDLTKLLNRRAFFERAGKQFIEAKHTDSNFSLLMLDLDYFKQVNDEYGHVVGDHCLAWVAQHIRAELRETDVPARIGGEEFAIALAGANGAQAERVSKRICAQIAEHPCEVEGKSINLTVSIGVINRVQKHEHLQELLAEADAALYEAKERGRNQVVVSH